MSSESIPLNHSGKSVIFIMHEVLRADEFKGVGMRIREGFQQNHSFSTSGKGKIVSWNRPPLGFKVGLRHLSFHCALLERFKFLLDYLTSLFLRLQCYIWIEVWDEFERGGMGGQLANALALFRRFSSSRLSEPGRGLPGNAA
jgi:hypothetical protein